MEMIEENLPSFTICPEKMVNLQKPKEEEKFKMDTVESVNEFVCEICSKTFFNATALRNHTNMQHDVASDDQNNQPSYIINDKPSFGGIKFDKKIVTPKLELGITQQNLVGLCGFKFIPLHKDGQYHHSEKDGVITQTFEEDTSFLIIKLKGENVDMDGPKGYKIDSLLKKNISKDEKPPIDLRGPFTCTFPSTLCPDLQCRQIFFNCCEYSLHYRENHTKRRKAALRCQICEERLDRDIFPTNPLNVQFQPPSAFVSFSCRLCGQTFLDSAQFEEHNRAVHTKIKPYQCSICYKRFTQQGGLQQHMRMHTGIRPYTCTFCPKAFTQKAGLEQHLRTHTKVKPFSCVICNKSFSQSVHLRQHMRTHTNIQPFECSVCGRRFKQSSHLNFHMRSHEDEMGEPLAVRYDTEGQQQSQLDFLKLAYLQPVQDGETIYYAAELAPQRAQANRNPFSYQTSIVPENMHTFTLD